ARSPRARREWRGAGPGELSRDDPAQRGQPPQAGLGGEDAGGGFFQRCLAQSKGATPAERRLWREGIYAHIRDVMSVQGSLSIERMCEVGPGRRGGCFWAVKG